MGKKKTCKKTIMGAKVSENSDIPDDVKEAAENLELGASSGKIQTDISTTWLEIHLRGRRLRGAVHRRKKTLLLAFLVVKLVQ
jgi:hypothetical protein